MLAEGKLVVWNCNMRDFPFPVAASDFHVWGWGSFLLGWLRPYRVGGVVLRLASAAVSVFAFLQIAKIILHCIGSINILIPTTRLFYFFFSLVTFPPNLCWESFLLEQTM